MSAPGVPPAAAPRAGRPALSVLVVAEQLRRVVPGGIGTYTRGLVTGLGALDPELAPLVTLAASRAPRSGGDAVAALGPAVRTVGLGPRALVAAWDHGLARVGRDASVVHACSTLTPPSSAPLVATVHDLAWRHLEWAFPPRGRRWHEASLRRAVRRASAIVVPSEAVVDEGADHLPAPDDRAAAAALDALGVTGEYLLAVGTLEPRKNLVRLVEAYAAARPSLPEPWPLVVVGPAGWGRSTGVEAPPPGVVLAGVVGDAELAALYARARCVAYVPLLEGYGLPVVEAMRAGAPVVASAVPSARGAALEVDPLDVDSIAAGLVVAATDGERRARLVAAGLERTGGLTWRRCAEQHVALWRRVVAAGAAT